MLFPYTILFFKQLGLTTTECSIIYGCLPIFNGFFNIFTGAVADKLQIHRQITLLWSILSAILLNCLLLVPPIPVPHADMLLYSTCTKHWNNSVTCSVDIAEDFIFESNGNITVQSMKKSKAFESCSSFWNISGENICSEIIAIIDETKDKNPNFHINFDSDIAFEIIRCRLNCSGYSQPTRNRQNVYGTTFWMAFILYFTSVNLFNSAWVLLMAMTFAVLRGERNAYGKQRTWGSIGALITSAISAITMNKYGSSNNEITFIPCFISFGICTVLTGTSAMFFKLPKIPSNPTMTKDFLKLLKEPKICLLFVVFFVSGFLYGAVETYLFVFLRELIASSWVLGSCLFARFLGEIPSLYYSGAIIEKIGHIRCLYLMFLVLSLRYLGTSLIPNPWWELPLSFVRSVVYSIGFTAICVYGSLITPPSMHATLQGVVQLVTNGFGKYPQKLVSDELLCYVIKFQKRVLLIVI